MKQNPFKHVQATGSITSSELLTQKVLARWDNEGGAGPDGPQETHSIRPAIFPQRVERRWQQNLSGGGHVLIRSINKTDASAERAFIEGLSANTQRMRFMAQIRYPSDKLINELTQVDGISQVALVAVTKDGAAEKIVGVSRYHLDAAKNHCECALVVADEWQHKGLGTALMKHLINIARSNHITAMESVEFAENTDMRTLMHELGFHLRSDPNDATQVIYRLVL
jgi:GNAT superfamily N-acetyltransferase